MNNYVFSSFERRWRKCVKVGIFSVERKRDQTSSKKTARKMTNDRENAIYR